MEDARVELAPEGTASEDAAHAVFISYSRVDGDFVRGLQQALEARNRKVWVDWQDIPPTAEWMDEIRGAMDGSDAVVFVLSPDSVASRVCGEELEHAIASNKRIVPLVARTVDPEATPDALSRLNWIIVGDDGLDGAVDRLVGALDTDLDRVRAHSRLLVRAREWAGKGEDASLLLRGSDLGEAEAFMGADAEPRPTPEQARFIVASRQAATSRQRRTVILVTVALVVAAVLGVFAWAQRGTAIAERDIAVRKTRISTSRELAVQALSVMDKQPDLGSLLSVEANRAWPTAESDQALHVAEQRTASIQHVIREHDDWVLGVAFSPDGSLVAAASQDGTVTVSSSASGRSVTEPLQVGRPVWTLAFSPDGKVLAAGWRHGVSLWNTTTWNPVRAPIKESSLVAGVAFSPDGRFLAVGGTSGKIALLDTRSWAVSGRTMEAGSGLLSVAFSPDSRLLAAASQDTGVSVWSVARRKPSTDLHTQGSFPIVAFSPRGHLFAAGNENGEVFLWSTKGGHLIRTFHGPAGDDVLGLAFDPAGDMLASTTGDGRLMLWDVVTGKAMGDPLDGHDGPVDFVAFSEHGDLLASGGDDGTVVLRAAPDDVRVGAAGAGAQVARAALSLDGQEVASASDASDRNAGVSISDAGTGRVIATGLGGLKGGEIMAFSPDGKTIGVGFKDGTVHLFDDTNGHPGHVLTGHQGPVVSLTFSPDGRLVAAGGEDKRVTVWDVKSGKQVGHTLTGQQSWIFGVAFSPDGHLLASGSFDGSTLLWDTGSWRRVGPPLRQRGQVSNVAFSPDGRLLATGSYDGSVTLWNPATGRRVGSPLLGLTSTIYWLAFSPDGRVVVASDSGGRLAAWAVASGEEIGEPLTAQAGPIHALGFDQNGTLRTVGDDGRVVHWDPQLWSPDTSSLADRLCSVEARNLTTDEWNQYFPGQPYHRTCPQWPAGS